MRAFTVCAASLIVAACGPTPQPDRAMDSAAGTTSRLAIRREPQADLDSVRMIVEFTRPGDAAVPLRRAAALLYEHAGIPASAAKSQLRLSAEELDGLADRLEAGDTLAATRAIDAAIRRVNVVEAEHHHSLAIAAWARRDTLGTGDELVMTADHLDRALRDVNPALTPQWKTLLGHTYELGTAMIDGAALNTMDIGSTLSRLQGVIRNELRRK